MKSLNFNKLNLQTEDVLNKTQMKRILGGYEGSVCPTTSCNYTTFSNGKATIHTDGTCSARGGIQTGCACNGGEPDSACD